MVIISPNNLNHKESSWDDMLEDLREGRYLKYIFQNKVCNKDEVRKLIFSKKIELKPSEIFYVEISRFKQIANGSCIRLKGKKK